MSLKKILYAEDDEALAFLTKENLEQNNYKVNHCSDGLSCLEAFRQGKFDICILDIMLPKMDGFELTTSLRKLDPQVPILFLSSKTLREDRIRGLRLGGDDYLVKPFSMEELILKVEVFIRRSSKSAETALPLTAGDYSFDPANYSLSGKNKKIILTQRESELLSLFIENKEKVLKRDYILKTIWGNDDYFLGRSLDVFVSRLRKILAGESISIENLHGIGFRYSEKKPDQVI
jgi:DNA-binding response OmpR family regulator